MLFRKRLTDIESAFTETDSFESDNTYLSSECRGVSRIFTPNVIPFESSCEIVALSGQSCNLELELLEEPSPASSTSSQDAGMIAGVSVGAAAAAAAGVALFFKKKRYSVMSKGSSNRDAETWIEHGIEHKYAFGDPHV